MHSSRSLRPVFSLIVTIYLRVKALSSLIDRLACKAVVAAAITMVETQFKSSERASCAR